MACDFEPSKSICCSLIFRGHRNVMPFDFGLSEGVDCSVTGCDVIGIA